MVHFEAQIRLLNSVLCNAGGYFTGILQSSHDVTQQQHLSSGQIYKLSDSDVFLCFSSEKKRALLKTSSSIKCSGIFLDGSRMMRCLQQWWQHWSSKFWYSTDTISLKTGLHLKVFGCDSICARALIGPSSQIKPHPSPWRVRNHVTRFRLGNKVTRAKSWDDAQ